MRLLSLFVCALTIPAWGGETAVLISGMRYHLDRHEDAGGMIRLYRGAAVTEMPREMVSAFEPDEAPPAPPPEPAISAARPAPDVAADQSSATATQAHSTSTRPIADPKTLVREAAARAGLPAAFVESVAKTESAFDPAAVSPKGALGVMQLMPATAKSLGADASDPAQNIEAGAKLLRELLIKYNGDVVKALAAYNAGEAAVDRYQGLPPYPETQHYVNSVVRDYLKTSGQ